MLDVLFSNKEFELFQNLKFKIQSIMDDIMQNYYKKTQEMVNQYIYIEANSIDQKHKGTQNYFIQN